MPRYNVEYRGVEEIVFVAYFNKTSTLPSFIADFLWSNIFAACLDVGQQLYGGVQAVMDVARLPEIGRKTVFRNVVTA